MYTVIKEKPNQSIYISITSRYDFFFSSSIKQNKSGLAAGLGSSIKTPVTAVEDILLCTACSFLSQSMLSYFSSNTKIVLHSLHDRPVLEVSCFGKGADLKYKHHFWTFIKI